MPCPYIRNGEQPQDFSCTIYLTLPLGKWQTFGQETSDVQIWHDVVQHRWEYVLAVFKIIMVADFHDPGESLHSTDESFFV